MLTEAGSKRRASLHRGARRGRAARHDPGGLEVFEADLEEFRAALLRENHTLKRALTDPRLFSGIGNAYSDEILHRARLSPLRADRDARGRRGRAAVRGDASGARRWTERLRRSGDGFPEKVTAFRAGMAVHGRYGQPCPVCGTTGAAHPLRRQRDQLLPALPDRRPAAGRPRAVATAQAGLAESIEELEELALARRPVDGA